MQNVLNFLLSNIVIVMIVAGGLFNVGVRLHQKAREQRAKRAALAEIQRRKSEALRTGKPMTEPVIVYDEPQRKQKPETQSEADARQQRIEALRQQRMEQLRAMRQKRSGGAAPAGTPQQPPIARPSPRVPAAGPAPARVQPPRQGDRRTPQPTAQPPARQPARPAPVMPQARPMAPAPAPAAPAAPAAGTSAYEIDTKPIRSRSIVGDDAISARTMLRDPRLARQAIVAREILSTPIALRGPESAPGELGA